MGNSEVRNSATMVARVELPAGVWLDARAEALRQRRSIGQLVEAALLAYLHGGKSGPSTSQMPVR